MDWRRPRSGLRSAGRIAEGRVSDLVLLHGDLEKDVSRSRNIVAI